MRFVAFDIETDSLSTFLCGGIMLYSKNSIVSEYFWFQNNENPAKEMLERLSYLQKQGYVVVGFNSTSFDWRILAKDSGEYELAEIAALESSDIMLEFFFRLGYMCSLDSILSRYSITQKRKKSVSKSGKEVSVGGQSVDKLWKDGEYKVVLDYLSDDVRATLELAETIHAEDKILYRTAAGKEREVILEGGLRKVSDLWKLPEPDVSWIKNNIKRDYFFTWINITSDVIVSEKWFWKELPKENHVVLGKFKGKTGVFVWPIYIRDNVWYSLDDTVLKESPIAWAYTQKRPK